MKITYSLIIGILALLNSCAEEKANQKNLFYYVSTVHNKQYNSDTFTLDKVRRYDPKDTLIAQEYFEHEGNIHTINMFTNDFYAPIDGGSVFYELDSLGIIYSKSTTWFSYLRLKSNNDSINKLIEIAMENLLLYEKFNYDNHITDRTIVFDEPAL